MAVSQELTGGTPEAFNAIALEALECGQNELNIWLDAPSRRGLDADEARDGVGVCGVSLATLSDMRTALKGVHLAMVSLYLRPGLSGVAVLAQLLALAEEQGVAPADLRACVEIDPCAWLVETGTLPQGIKSAYGEMASALQSVSTRFPGVQVIGVQGHGYHNGGASSTQELAAILATGSAYLSAMQEAGIDPAITCRHMRLSVSVGGNYFIEIAKIRALRWLWSQVLTAFGVAAEDQVMHIHARTGLWNKTIFDPYVNLLRTTTEAFSAVLGGCDSLHVGCFDEMVREADTFSRRIARNTQHVLMEECDMTRVIDPAGGSWAVEVLTDNMARQAWKGFQEIEARGGIISALESGWLQTEIAKVATEKSKGLESRRDVLVGTNVYPNATEKPLPPAKTDYQAIAAKRKATVQAARSPVQLNLTGLTGTALIETVIQAVKKGATLGQINAALLESNAGVQAPAIKLSRGAEPFERLRVASAVFAAANGHPPQVFQANMGPSRKYRLRADWTTAFFHVGGIEVLADVDFASVEEAVQAALTANAKVVVITSDDESYPATVPALAQALKTALPEVSVLVAGAAGEAEAEWQQSGVDGYINVRVDIYHTLKALLNKLGATV
ncbi:MAG: acyl-CoA mutase large subunit family protein [Verrucomicrobia bacterium]|nr:acyl-CoA mutase large subunit family protein [Verrucomicrobiota bacterium]